MLFNELDPAKIGIILGEPLADSRSGLPMLTVRLDRLSQFIVEFDSDLAWQSILWIERYGARL